MKNLHPQIEKLEDRKATLSNELEKLDNEHPRLVAEIGAAVLDQTPADPLRKTLADVEHRAAELRAALDLADLRLTDLKREQAALDAQAEAEALGKLRAAIQADYAAVCQGIKSLEVQNKALETSLDARVAFSKGKAPPPEDKGENTASQLWKKLSDDLFDLAIWLNSPEPVIHPGPEHPTYAKTILLAAAQNAR